MRNFWILVLFCLTLERVSSKNIEKRSFNCNQQCTQSCQTTCNNCQYNCNNCQSDCLNNCRSICGSNDCRSNNCNNNNNNNCNSNTCNNNNCNTNNCRNNNCNSNTCNNNNNCNSNNCGNQQNNNCNNCDVEPQREVVVEEKVPVLVPFPPPAEQQRPSSQVISPTIISNNTNNYTSEININNVVNTVNNVSIPISVNSSNVNHISILPAPRERVVEYEETKQDTNCCIVIHPKECDSRGQCYTRSSWECGEICKGSVVTIEKEIETITTQPPPVQPPIPIYNCSTQQIAYYPPNYVPQLPCQTYVNGVRNYCQCPQQQQQQVYQQIQQAQPVYIPQPVVYQPAPEVRYQPATEVRYQAAPEIRYQQVPEVRYQPVTEVRYQQVPEVRYQPAPEVSYQPVPQIRYQQQYQQVPTTFLSWYQQYQQPQQIYVPQQSPCQASANYPYRTCGNIQQVQQVQSE